MYYVGYPKGPNHTTVVSEFLFRPETIADPDFDPASVVELWDLISKQDWEVVRARADRRVVARVHPRRLPAPGPLPLLVQRGMAPRHGPPAAGLMPPARRSRSTTGCCRRTTGGACSTSATSWRPRRSRAPLRRRSLPRDERDLSSIGFAHDGEDWTLSRMLEATFTDGFLVLQHGTIVAESYFNGMTPATPHLCFSVTKSVVATVAGILVGRGRAGRRRPAAVGGPRTRRHVVGGRHGAAGAGHAHGHAVQRGLRGRGGRHRRLRPGLRLDAAARARRATRRARVPGGPRERSRARRRLRLPLGADIDAGLGLRARGRRPARPVDRAGHLGADRRRVRRHDGRRRFGARHGGGWAQRVAARPRPLRAPVGGRRARGRRARWSPRRSWRTRSPARPTAWRRSWDRRMDPTPISRTPSTATNGGSWTAPCPCSPVWGSTGSTR